MNNKVSLVAALIMSAGLVGCNDVKDDVVADCVFPDSPTTAAPGWICDEPVEGVAVSAVGSATKSAAGHGFMKQMAATDARVQLAQRMKVQVSNMVKQYVETTGAADTETVDKVLTSVSKQITSESLVGTRVYKSRVSPTGNLYVLVGVDAANVQAQAKTALKTSMNNDNAAWQEFKSKKGQDELAAEISKIDAKK